jgi:hypothetical protein
LCCNIIIFIIIQSFNIKNIIICVINIFQILKIIICVINIIMFIIILNIHLKNIIICVRNIESIIESRGNHFRFDSVFIKKCNQTEFFEKKKNRNRFRFGSVFWTKTGSNRFGSVLFLVVFGLGLVQFGFFDFRLIKLKPNRTGRFFQNFIRFNRVFFMFRFSRLFFLFSRFNQFFSFFAHP